MPCATMQKLVIFGDRTANEVWETAEMAYAGEFAVIQKSYFDPATFDKLADDLDLDAARICYHAAVANARVKSQIVEAAESRNWQPQSIVHPTAVVAATARIAPGCYIGPLAVISSHAQVSAHCIVHIHASIGHDAQLGSMCATLPGARISGHVQAGARSLVGSNAFVAAGVRLGEDCQVDALTYVNHDLPDEHIASVRSPRPVRRIDL